MVLAVDLGQSGARLRWNAGEHTSLRAKEALESPLNVLRDIFIEVTSLLGQPLVEEVVALSLSGIYGLVPNPKPYGELANEFFSATQVAVIDDGLAGYVGAMGAADGVALSIGSGVVAVAGKRGKYAHADGLGHIFGDEGGGYWLGKHGLERALAARQGRESDAALLDYLRNEIAQFDNLVSKTGAAAQILCIHSAKKILEAADDRISSAVAIRERGSEQLAKTVGAAWIKAGGLQNEGLSLAILGGVSRSRSYEESIKRKVTHLLPQARLITPKGSQLEGALAITTSMRSDVLPLLRWWRHP
jgi:glucosamine kinase